MTIHPFTIYLDGIWMVLGVVKYAARVKTIQNGRELPRDRSPGLLIAGANRAVNGAEIDGMIMDERLDEHPAGAAARGNAGAEAKSRSTELALSDSERPPVSHFSTARASARPRKRIYRPAGVQQMALEKRGQEARKEAAPPA